MRRFSRRRINLLILFVILLLSMGLGYASLNTQLSISGTTEITGNTWNIAFNNVTLLPSSTATINTPPTITNNTTLNFNVTLTQPNELLEYSVNVTNNGTIAAEISNISMTQLTPEQANYLEFYVTDNNGNPIGIGTELNVGKTLPLIVHIKYKDVSNNNLVNTNTNLTLSYTLNFVQDMDPT